MPNFRLLQLAGDFVLAGYSLEEPDIFGFGKSSPVDYIVVHRSMGLPMGRLSQAGHLAPINYDAFPYDDVEGNYYSEQAHVIFRSRARLVHVE
ncbi:MAG: hypothetical protein HYT72_00805 [Candidatus Aenigmarchaeota archaeon]|nr:hypothetical protein [Candidatus Aenigmarchaeota archaeon]